MSALQGSPGLASPTRSHKKEIHEIFKCGSNQFYRTQPHLVFCFNASHMLVAELEVESNTFKIKSLRCSIVYAPAPLDHPRNKYNGISNVTQISSCECQPTWYSISMHRTCLLCTTTGGVESNTIKRRLQFYFSSDFSGGRLMGLVRSSPSIQVPSRGNCMLQLALCAREMPFTAVGTTATHESALREWQSI